MSTVPSCHINDDDDFLGPPLDNIPELAASPLSGSPSIDIDSPALAFPSVPPVISSSTTDSSLPLAPSPDLPSSSSTEPSGLSPPIHSVEEPEVLGRGHRKKNPPTMIMLLLCFKSHLLRPHRIHWITTSPVHNFLQIISFIFWPLPLELSLNTTKRLF